MKKNKERVHPINTIGFIQRAIVKDCLLDYDDVTTLVHSMNLDHHKHKDDVKYTQKNLMPHLVKIVRKKHKWHEEIRDWNSYKEWVKVYKLNSIRNYKDIAKAIESGPAVIKIPIKRKDGVKI